MDDSYNSRNGENILQIVFRESFFSNQAVFWLKWGNSWSFCNILNVNRLYSQQFSGVILTLKLRRLYAVITLALRRNHVGLMP